MDEDQKVIEGETVETPASDGDNSSVILNMENMIKTLVSTLDRQREEVSKYKEALDSIFENDETYKAHFEAAKQASTLPYRVTAKKDGQFLSVGLSAQKMNLFYLLNSTTCRDNK